MSLYTQGARAAQAQAEAVAYRREHAAWHVSASSLVGRVGADAPAPVPAPPGAVKTALAFGLLGVGALAVGGLWYGTGRWW